MIKVVVVVVVLMYSIWILGVYYYFVYYGCGLRLCSFLDKYLINKKNNKI